MIKLDKKYTAYLKQQLCAESVALGTPVFKSLNACLFASLIGYNDNYRSAYKKKNGEYIFFVIGNKLNLNI